MSNELSLIIYFLLTTLVAGIAGTGAMTLFMWSITRAGLTNADMVRAIGSIFTKSLDNALLVGTMIHFISGVFWAVVYTLIFNFLHLHGLWVLTPIGMGIGLAQGFVLSFLLVSSVAQHHPLPEFHEAGFAVAIAHLLGHGIFGAVVGFVVGLLGFSVG